MAHAHDGEETRTNAQKPHRMATVPPSHADYTYQAKFGIRAAAAVAPAHRGTIGRVAAGYREKILRELHGIEILAYVESVEGISLRRLTQKARSIRSSPNIVRCPDRVAAEKMFAHRAEMRNEGNTVGGVIGCVARKVPFRLGEPCSTASEADQRL